MTIYNVDLIDSLILQYNECRVKWQVAIDHRDAEYASILTERMRYTRSKLDIVMQAQQDELYLGGHELIEWADDGYPPPPPPPQVVHEAIVGIEQRQSEYIVPRKPTAADWQRAALRYVETGSEEHYGLMLNMVSLDHPVPNLWAEANLAKTTSKTIAPRSLADFWTSHKSMTLGDIWYGIRWYVLVFTIWAIIIVVAVNQVT